MILKIIELGIAMVIFFLFVCSILYVGAIAEDVENEINKKPPLNPLKEIGGSVHY